MRVEVLRDEAQQTVWGWKIAAYLFGAGMGAGAYAAGAATALLPGWGSASEARVYMAVGTATVLASVPLLVWDLGRPERFLRVLLKVRRSWLSRGAWILLLFGALAVTTLVLGVPRWLAGLSLAAAVAVALYTGLLMGSMVARPLWNSPILPVLFLVSAFSTGLALVRLVSIAASNGSAGASLPAPSLLPSVEVGLLATETLVLYFYLAIAYLRIRTPVESLLYGHLAPTFWLGVVGIGLIIPLVLQIGRVHLAGSAAARVELLADACLLAGGFLLRYVLLRAGVRGPAYLGAPFVIRPEV